MKIPPDIRNALLAFAAIVVLGLLIAQVVRADDWQRPDEGWLPTGAHAYLQIDADAPVGGGGHPYCHDTGHEVGRVYEHNSCLTAENDHADSDAIGIRVRIILGN